MLSLRLPPALDGAITQIAKQLGLSRSAWLRQLIENGIAAQALPDPYLRYQQVMTGIAAPTDLSEGHRARDHSQEIKARLKAKRTTSAPITVVAP